MNTALRTLIANWLAEADAEEALAKKVRGQTQRYTYARLYRNCANDLRKVLEERKDGE